MKSVTCPTCFILYGIPDEMDARALQKKQNLHIYCPSGHAWWYTGETEAEKERRLRQRAEQQIARAEEEKRAAEQEAEKARKKLKRVERRIHAGVCPDCNRTFANVARHMATKHTPKCDNVTPLKVVK